MNTAINTLLDAGTSVTITTTGAGSDAGNITINAAISKSTTTGSPTLTFTAANNITVNSAISNSVGTLHLVFNAASITLNSSLSTLGTQTYNGPVTLGAASTLTGTTVTFTSTVAGGANSLAVTGNASFGGAVTGVSTLSVSGTTTISANITTTGSAGVHRCGYSGCQHYPHHHQQCSHL